MGIARLSSANPKDTFSTIAPTAAAIIPIRYSIGRSLTFGVKKTTILALIKKAKVPSRLLENNLCFPNFLPISAAIESLIIKIVKAVINNILGKRITQISAEIRT